MRASQKKPVYTGLAGKIGENGHDVKYLGEVLGVSADTIRRSLRGERQFELREVHKLMNLYKCSFDDLFGSITPDATRHTA